MTMIEITKDKKSPTWIISKTDAEGFHHQLQVTTNEMFELGKRIFSALNPEPFDLRKIKFLDK